MDCRKNATEKNKVSFNLHHIMSRSIFPYNFVCGCILTILIINKILQVNCVDLDNGKKDTNGKGCDHYHVYPGECGSSDNADFKATQLCCSCRGIEARSIFIELMQYYSKIQLYCV